MRYRHIRTVGDLLDAVDDTDPAAELVWETHAASGDLESLAIVEARAAAVFIRVPMSEEEAWDV